MMRTTRPPARALRAGARGREGARDSNRPPNASEREGTETRARAGPFASLSLAVPFGPFSSK